MANSNQNSRESASQKQSLLAKLDIDDLKTINIKITRKNFTGTASNLPLQRGLDDPSLLVVHYRMGEGEKPIFDRDDIIVNKAEEEERVVSSSPTHHRPSEKIIQSRNVRRSRSRSYPGSNLSKNKHNRRSRSYSSKSRSKSPYDRSESNKKYNRNSKERDKNYTSGSKIKGYGSSHTKKRSLSRDRYENESQRFNTHPPRNRSKSPSSYSDRDSRSFKYTENRRRTSRSPAKKDHYKEKRFHSRTPERDYYKRPTYHDYHRDDKRKLSRSPIRKDYNLRKSPTYRSERRKSSRSPLDSSTHPRKLSRSPRNYRSKSPDRPRSPVDRTYKRYSRSPPYKGRRSRTPGSSKSRRSKSPRPSTSVLHKRHKMYSKSPTKRREGEFTREDYERSKDRGRSRSPKRTSATSPDGRARRSRSKEKFFRGPRIPPEFAYYGGEEYWIPGALPRPAFIPAGYLPPGAFPRRLPGPPMLLPRMPMMLPPHHHQFRQRLPVYNQPTRPKITLPTSTITTVTSTSTSNSDVSTTNAGEGTSSTVTITECTDNTTHTGSPHDEEHITETNKPENNQLLD